MPKFSLFKQLLAPRHMEYLIIDRDMKIVDGSFGVHKFAELPEQAIAGQDLRISFPEFIGFEETLPVILGGQQGSFELQGVTRSIDEHNSLYLDIYVVKLEDDEQFRDSLIVCLEDVTEKMHLRQNLVQQANEAHLLLTALTIAKDYVEKVITSMSESLIVTNASGLIKTVNPAAIALFGYTEPELLQHPVSLLFTELPLTAVNPQELLKNQEIACHHKDGHELYIEVSCTPIQTDIEGLFDYVYISRDITERKRTERELQIAYANAEAASKAKSLFLANMSHEIRTPMNGILGVAELLLESNVNSEQKEFVEMIRTSGNVLLNIINEILDLSKLEAGEMRLEVLVFDLYNTVEEVVDLMATQAHNKGLEIIAWIDHRIPHQLLGDGNRLRQVITNLISNAVKFTWKGEIQVRIELKAFTPSTVSLRFTIKDSGIGIADNDTDKLFKPFVQLDDSTTRTVGGTGLGLSICHQLIKLMGGTIGVNSQPKHGSEFWFELSLPIASQTAEPTVTTLPSGLRILVVDDKPSVGQATAEQLKQWQIEVDTTTNTTALPYLLQKLELGICYDVILIDLLMPTIDGLRLAAEIQNHQQFSNVPLILMVTTSQLNLAQYASEFGFSNYLIKPLKTQRLWQALHTTLLKYHPPKHTEVAVSSPTPDTTKPEILVVEDNLVNQRVVVKQLESFGYKVEVANNGNEAVEMWLNNKYKLILMDCQMPVLDGYDATRAIRHSESQQIQTYTPVIIIAMTANAMKEDRSKCLAAGMDDYISKPWRKEQLQSLLSYWLNSPVKR